jgi:hypothetical protein
VNDLLKLPINGHGGMRRWEQKAKIIMVNSSPLAVSKRSAGPASSGSAPGDE